MLDEYSKMIFMSKEKEKEWNEMDLGVKKHVLSHLERYTEKMSNSTSIQLLCHCINELDKRIEKLEKTGNLQ